MEIEEKQFKKMFPRLAKEMQPDKCRITINSVRSRPEVVENVASKNFVYCEPNVIDFLRRCDNRKQVEEIITYLEKRKEISSKYARKLRRQLKEKGLRSFGPKKEEDYYFEQATRNRRQKTQKDSEQS